MQKEKCFIFMTLIFGAKTALSNTVFNSFGNPVREFRDDFFGEFENGSLQINGFTDTSRTNRQINLSPNYYQKFVNDSLTLHNEYRLKHGVGPLTFSQKLSNNALKWAKTLLQKNSFYHQPNNDYGENLYATTALQVTARMPFFAWYNECKNYDYSREPLDLDAGHFTQVVWKNTKFMGIAIVKSKSRKTLVVAEYYPPGNVIGKFRSNVMKLRK